MANKKISALTAMSTPSGVDLLAIVDDPSGTPETQKITLTTLFGNIPGDLTVSAGYIGTGAGSELTIKTGEVRASQSRHTIDTESDALSDDLDTITGGSDGHILIIRAENSLRTVVVKDGTGNLKLAGDFSLDHIDDTMILLNVGGTIWVELTRSNNST